MFGTLLAATNYRMEELIQMDPEIRAFLYHSVQKHQAEQMREFGRALGVYFTAGEIRSWTKGEGGKVYYEDSDGLTLPLSLTLKPELRDHLTKLVSGTPLPRGYVKGDKEVVVDLGRVTTQQFRQVLEDLREGRTPTPLKTP